MVQKIDKVEPGTQIILLGDLNMSFKKKESLAKRNFPNGFRNSMEINNLQQIDDNEITCSRGQGNSLDHIFSTG